MGTKLFRRGLLMFILVLTGSLSAQTTDPFYTTYNFGNDNAVPGSSVIPYNGMLLGTSYSGGGNGSFYSLTAMPNHTYSGKQLIYFPGGNSGGNPYSNPLLTRGSSGVTSGIWLTTQTGGNAGGGTLVYTLPDGSSSWTAHNFNSSTEGSQAQGELSCFDVPNAMGYQAIFGTLTTGGSSNDAGAIFAQIVSNNLPVQYDTVYDFSKTDGGFPIGRLEYSHNFSGNVAQPQPNAVTPSGAPTFDLSSIVLYGVTKNGGSNNYGEIYSVHGDGSSFKQMHAFNFGTTDGYFPQGGLVRSGNLLYGTTSGGGSNYGGTLFQINTNGTGFQLLFHFASSSFPNSGNSPKGDLVLHRGLLYGTTYSGGASGGGTVYSINTNGSNFTVLHSFSTPIYNGNGGYTNKDGGYSVQGLLYDNNVLYGVTPYGGTNGVGTAYEIILPFRPRLQVANTSGTLHFTWPSTALGYLLEQNSDLATTNWTTNGVSIPDAGTNNNAILGPRGTKTFFRLIQ